MEPETWQLDKDDRSVTEAILQRNGFDATAPNIHRALANIHPVILPQSIVETLSEQEQAAYWREIEALKSPGWNHPAYKDVELPG